MGQVEVRAGDIVCTTYREGGQDQPSFWQRIVSGGIRWGQRFNDVDGRAQMTHALVVTNKKGDTFEALWKYRSQNLFHDYSGNDVLVGRHHDMDPIVFYEVHQNLVRLYAGRRYPAWKIPLFFAAPRVIKYLPGKPVCSELAMRYWYEAGLIKFWRGVSPSYLADLIRRWRKIDIIYEGRLS